MGIAGINQFKARKLDEVTKGENAHREKNY